VEWKIAKIIPKYILKFNVMLWILVCTVIDQDLCSISPRQHKDRPNSFGKSLKLCSDLQKNKYTLRQKMLAFYNLLFQTCGKKTSKYTFTCLFYCTLSISESWVRSLHFSSTYTHIKLYSLILSVSVFYESWSDKNIFSLQIKK